MAPDGKVVRTAAPSPRTGTLSTPRFSSVGPHPASTPKDQLVPPLTNVTIGDRLSAKGVSWAWYSGGWDTAVAGHPGPLFQFNEQPFAYFANYAPGTPGFKHLKDETAFDSAVAHGTLPAVSFVKPYGPDNEHPGYTDLNVGDAHAAALVESIMHSPAVEQHCDHRYLRRERRLLGPCRSTQVGPLRGRHEGACHRHFPVRTPSLRRPHDVRHHVDPRLDREALRPAAAEQS